MQLTIFTPTYNRASHLSTCYKSLLKQSFTDFEWLIIDDGSTDKTKTIVDSFINENKISIRYLYQDNGGKQSAWNHAVKEAQGTYFIGVDSDDALVEESLAGIFREDIPLIENDPEIIGIRALSIRESNYIIDSTFAAEKAHHKASWFEEFASRIQGERIDIFKTQELMAYLYPVQKEVTFIPEIWFYVTISKKYQFLYTNKQVRLFYDNHQDNRLSRSSLAKHAKGHKLARSTMLLGIPVKYWLKNPVALIKTLIRYGQASYYVKRK